jgi:hypothetical protein
MSSISQDGEVPYLPAASVQQSEKGRSGRVRRVAIPVVLGVTSAGILALAALHGGSSNAAAAVTGSVVTGRHVRTPLVVCSSSTTMLATFVIPEGIGW